VHSFSDPTAHLRQLELAKTGLRDIAHEISNPLGVLRMVGYFLERGEVRPEKIAEYAAMISQSLDRIDHNLQKLNELRRSLPDGPPA
jgi:nitrogen-specific signal transduction histidine kinase